VEQVVLKVREREECVQVERLGHAPFWEKIEVFDEYLSC
jgi:hypothetical protein